MPKRPFSDEEDFESDSNEEVDDDENDDDDDDDDDYDESNTKAIIRRKVFSKHLPDLKEMVRKTFGDKKPNLVTDREERSCAICPNLQWFKGWKALQAHAETFKKRKVHHHRCYADAIKEALQSNAIAEDEADARIGTRTASLDIEAAKSKMIVWPPVLCIQSRDDRSTSFPDMVQRFLSDFGKRFPNVHAPKLHLLSSCEGLVEFGPDYFGFLDAEFMRDNHRQFSYPINVSLVIPSAMKVIDGQRKLVDWKEESYHEKVREPQRKAKEAHDHEQAQLKEMQIKVETLTEDEERFNIKKTRFEMLISSRQSEIEEWKRRKEKIARDYENKMRSLDEKFQKDIQISEARSTAHIRRLQQKIEESENRLEEERIARMVEIENLQKQSEELTNVIKQEEAREALRKELQVMEKKKLFKENMEKRIADFERRAHEQESDLLEKQHHERMQLLEEAENEKQQLLQAWLSKQEDLKKSEEEGSANRKPEEEVIHHQKCNECVMCLDELTEENRAFLKPCGHATLCFGCALEIFKSSKKLCPMCRADIKGKPMLMPKKIFM